MLDPTPYRTPLADFARRWRVASVELFGSAVRDDFGPGSDVDVLLTPRADAAWSLFDLATMRQELEDVFGRAVDVTTRRAVEQSPNWIRRDAILGTAREVYAVG